MSYRSDLDALSARHAALETEVAHKTKELDSAQRLLDEARARARLPILDNIRVASPCTADWNEMTGDDRVRMCGQCNKHVFNLSAMTRDEAEALIALREGKLCARYYQRSDGTIMLADCAIGAASRRKRKLIAAGAAAALATGALAYKLTRRHEIDLHMGAIAMPTQATAPEHVEGTSQETPPPPALKVHVQEPLRVFAKMGDVSFQDEDR